MGLCPVDGTFTLQVIVEAVSMEQKITLHKDPSLVEQHVRDWNR